MAYISVLSTTETSIRVQMAGLQTDYAYSDRVCSWYLDGVYKGQTTLSEGVSSGGAYTFSGLKPGTGYTISVSITAPGWESTVDLDTYAETDELSVELWSWSSSNGSASVAQTQAAYNAVKNQGKLSQFSYLVWNDMVDKVYEILQANGYSWNNIFASYAVTKMSSGDKKLTATRFNSLRYNIEIHYSTGINTVYRGDVVYGWYFTTLADCMNNMI